jgi:hypothetical protein
MNDGLRAAVFARDKGICSFSGLSVWFLDHGTAPFSHADWIDHVRPKSRNGADTLDNLVCASYFYNRKKMNNGSDRQYLFSAGKPTETYFWTHGELTSQQAKLLKSHAGLRESDWYFNRAIYHFMIAIDDELAGVDVVRKRDFWLRAAHKRMSIWRKLTGGDTQTFVDRGLVKYPQAADVHLMLSLASGPEEKWLAIYRALLKLTRMNNAVFSKFCRAQNKIDRRDVILEAEASGRATAPLLDVMKKNAERL